MTQPANEKAMEFTQYRRTAVAEMVPWGEDVDMSRVSISVPDQEAGSPKLGDMIARNPANHDDQWLVAAAYFAANFEPLAAAPRALPADDVGEIQKRYDDAEKLLSRKPDFVSREFLWAHNAIGTLLQQNDRLTAALAEAERKIAARDQHIAEAQAREQVLLCEKLGWNWGAEKEIHKLRRELAEERAKGERLAKQLEWADDLYASLAGLKVTHPEVWNDQCEEAYREYAAASNACALEQSR